MIRVHLIFLLILWKIVKISKTHIMKSSHVAWILKRGTKSHFFPFCLEENLILSLWLGLIFDEFCPMHKSYGSCMFVFKWDWKLFVFKSNSFDLIRISGSFWSILLGRIKLMYGTFYESKKRFLNIGNSRTFCLFCLIINWHFYEWHLFWIC